MRDLVTFGLAFVAYLGLCADAVLRLRGRGKRAHTAGVAVLALVHVALVWGWRHGWDPALALAGGVAPFALFHVALAVMVVAALVPRPWAGRALAVAFPIVTAGAVGAVFRRPDVAGWRWPVVLAAAGTLVALVLAWRARGRPAP